MTTMRDVAELANVSTAVVSRVLNGDRTLAVSDNTRQRVLEAAKKLNYRVKTRRRLSKNKDSQSLDRIAIIRFQSEEMEKEDPYFSYIQRGIELEALRLGTVVHTYHWNDEELGLKQKASDYDGIIVVNGDNFNPECLGAKRLTFVDYCPDVNRYTSVVVDFNQATRTVLQHLVQLGHEKIGFIGGGRPFGKDPRHLAYESFMREICRFSEDDIFIGDWAMGSGYECMMEALSKSNRPTAFFVASDPMAIGALRAIHECGLKVPTDIAVVGFDDIETAAYVSPSLTTIHVNTELMGRLAVRLLQRPLDEDVPVQVHVPFHLVIRETCGGAADC
ncbi:LacI family DNA-binding transcriptional regulator [Alicyclobacillus herbarius]|uniref:LacI family DNA-binding transcriptional regulator n=1 Tax=Alicyclobacillus herbarius TaxID=122960 RepID=UPI0004240657|nr:LacI family DNA-binding transcriptional regulator [Alicyclobacillus herbarius]